MSGLVQVRECTMRSTSVECGSTITIACVRAGRSNVNVHPTSICILQYSRMSRRSDVPRGTTQRSGGCVDGIAQLGGEIEQMPDARGSALQIEDEFVRTCGANSVDVA